jgi:hypothetical protein
MVMIKGYPMAPRREMKLYTLDRSPYSTRVRAQIRHKGLPIEFVNPPQLRSECIESISPLGQLRGLNLATDRIANLLLQEDTV